jgi:hypothetical protein
MCYKKNFCQFFVILHLVSIALSCRFNLTAAKENHGPGSNSSAVSRCVERLSAAVEKAYADVGLSKEDIQGLLSVQRPPRRPWASGRLIKKLGLPS